MTKGSTVTPVYEPPTDGDDLNPIEEALVRALSAIIIRERRAEAAARTDTHTRTPAGAISRAGAQRNHDGNDPQQRTPRTAE